MLNPQVAAGASSKITAELVCYCLPEVIRHRFACSVVAASMQATGFRQYALNETHIVKELSSWNRKDIKHVAQECPDRRIGQQAAAQLPWLNTITLITQVANPQVRAAFTY